MLARKPAVLNFPVGRLKSFIFILNLVASLRTGCMLWDISGLKSYDENFLLRQNSRAGPSGSGGGCSLGGCRFSGRFLFLLVIKYQYLSWLYSVIVGDLEEMKHSLKNIVVILGQPLSYWMVLFLSLSNCVVLFPQISDVLAQCSPFIIHNVWTLYGWLVWAYQLKPPDNQRPALTFA